MKNIYIRIWTEKNISEITQHLMIIDDLYGMCANCKEVGLNFVKDTKCPKCGTDFKYLTTKNLKQVGKILQRIQMKKLPYLLIEKEDWEKAVAKQNINSLFSSNNS